MARPSIFWVDAFTDTSFTGNPAAICLLATPVEKRWMQKVAVEINLSETAFVVPQDDGFNLRWFTPIIEVDTCSHGTLASAHILRETGIVHPTEQGTFHTRSGIFTAVRRDRWIEVSFPIEVEELISPPDSLVAALGNRPAYTGLNRFDYLVEMEPEEIVRT